MSEQFLVIQSVPIHLCDIENQLVDVNQLLKHHKQIEDCLIRESEISKKLEENIVTLLEDLDKITEIKR
ncbi:MAG: hypothetical protein COA58_10480 [Bacteroidetes bacterium]|nr:MAG: hypothetical protein COA58_10480 [Bacteroidota bacterium]